MSIKFGKKQIIFIGLIILILLFCVILMFKTDFKLFSAITVTDTIEKRLETYYDYPCVALLKTDNTSLEIFAGYFRYGDVDKDGTIDDYDVETIQAYISGNVLLDDNSLKLADINNDGKVDSKDLLLLQSYLEKNGSKKYTVLQDNLQYCLQKSSNSNKCIWKSSNKFTVTALEQYSIFVKDVKNNKISLVKNYQHKIINYDSE